MITRKDLIIAVLSTFCLTTTLFMIVPTRSQSITAGIGEYDPWVDINDDGTINFLDAIMLGTAFGTTGTPINKTELLLELMQKIELLNSTIIEQQNEINYLNQTVICLNETITILNSTQGLGKPDYDSDWFAISSGEQVIKTHNLGTTNVLVYMVGKYSNNSSPYIHQRHYGGEETWPNYWGAYWQDLTETTIRVVRQGQDIIWNYVRLMIWKIPEP
jgi:hypothetical protein